MGGGEFLSSENYEQSVRDAVVNQENSRERRATRRFRRLRDSG